MKHAFFIFILFFISLFACQKDDIKYDLYFWTDEFSPIWNNKWTLYIDGENKGVLTNPPVVPNCSDHDSILSTLIHVQLPTGRYKIEAKDDNGTIKSSETLKLRKNGLSSRGGIGGSEMQGIDKCMVIRLFDHLK